MHRRIHLVDIVIHRCRMLVFLDPLRADTHVVEEPGQHRRAHGQQRQRLAEVLPQPDQRADHRLVRQAGVDPRRVGMVQYVHHMGAADTVRVVQPGVVVAPRLQIDDALVGMHLHLFLAAEDDRPGRAGLHAGRLQAHADAVGTQAHLYAL